MKLLFVCTGNTCRSCMAEGIAKKEAERLGMNIEISSAGIHAYAGDSASQNAAAVMESMGIDLSCHIARPVSKKLMEESDIILTMTRSHKETLSHLWPLYTDKIFAVKEYIGESGDIVDPFGGDISVYRNCAAELKDSIDKILVKIKES